MMAWGPFSAEAVRLDSKLRRLHKEGRITDAVQEIEKALRSAHAYGPSNESYESFEAVCRASGDDLD